MEDEREIGIQATCMDNECADGMRVNYHSYSLVTRIIHIFEIRIWKMEIYKTKTFLYKLDE
jgi:hypothetical protein